MADNREWVGRQELDFTVFPRHSTVPIILSRLSICKRLQCESTSPLRRACGSVWGTIEIGTPDMYSPGPEAGRSH